MSISLSSYSAAYPSLLVENEALKGSPSSVNTLKTQTADIHNTLVVIKTEQDTFNKAQWLKPADTTAASKQPALDPAKAAVAAKAAWDKAAALKIEYTEDLPQAIAAWDEAATAASAAWKSGNRDSSWDVSAQKAITTVNAIKAALSAEEKYNNTLEAIKDTSSTAAANTIATNDALFADAETASQIAKAWRTIADRWDNLQAFRIQVTQSFSAIPNIDVYLKKCTNSVNLIAIIAASARNAATTVAPAVTPAEIANAEAWKKKIVKIINKSYGKSTSKAQEIVDRLPTTAPGGLEKIYKNLSLIREDNGEHYDDLKEHMSWADEDNIFLCIMTLGLHLCCRDSPTKNTTAEQRLMLRALMIFGLSGVNPSLHEKNYSEYKVHIGNAVNNTWRIRNINIQALRDSLSQTEPQNWDVNASSKFMTYPTIISELQKLITD